MLPRTAFESGRFSQVGVIFTALLQPDTIIIEEVGNTAQADITLILETSTWSVRVIGLDLTNNRLSVYHCEDRTVLQAEDLVSLILSEPPKGKEE